MIFSKPKFWDDKQPSIWSIILYPFSIIYLLITIINKNLLSQKKFTIPIICVGNIYVGGTGKTPLAIEVYKIFKFLGKNPCFVKKGYDLVNDEVEMLKEIGRTYSNKNRKKSLISAVSQKHDVAIFDDGFQDFSIKKDISILCFHSKQLIGNGNIIPSGPLREGLGSIKRADCILINGSINLNFEKKLQKINDNIKIFYSSYKLKNIEDFKDKEIIAFAGIGNPSNFFDLLKENSLNVKKVYHFPDHYNYSDKDFEDIFKKNYNYDNTKIVTTKKDYFRLNEKQKLMCNYIDIDLEIYKKNDFVNFIKSKI